MALLQFKDLTTGAPTLQSFQWASPSSLGAPSQPPSALRPPGPPNRKTPPRQRLPTARGSPAPASRGLQGKVGLPGLPAGAGPGFRGFRPVTSDAPLHPRLDALALGRWRWGPSARSLAAWPLPWVAPGSPMEAQRWPPRALSYLRVSPHKPRGPGGRVLRGHKPWAR